MLKFRLSFGSFYFYRKEEKLISHQPAKEAIFMELSFPAADRFLLGIGLIDKKIRSRERRMRKEEKALLKIISNRKKENEEDKDNPLILSLSLVPPHESFRLEEPFIEKGEFHGSCGLKDCDCRFITDDCTLPCITGECPGEE